MFIRALPLFVLAACSTGMGEVEQLEGFDATALDASDDWEAQALTGLTQVEGADKSWTLTVDASMVEIHAAGGSDLSVLDGRTLDVALSERDWSENRSVVITEDGALRFAAGASAEDPTLVAALGSDFITWGEEAGSSSDSQYLWSWRYAVVSTDDGAVELLPGEAEEVVVNGEPWRVVVHAAYQVEAHPNAMLPCGGITDLLSFEVLHLDSPVGSALIERPDGAELAHAGCL